jgi:hypothetical protein
MQHFSPAKIQQQQQEVTDQPGFGWGAINQ